MIDTKQAATNIFQLLQADPHRYINFGVYWYFIKKLLKMYYTKDNLYLLGDYIDETVTDRMPPLASATHALHAAMEEYAKNAAYNLGSNVIVDPDGEEFILLDADAGM